MTKALKDIVSERLQQLNRNPFEAAAKGGLQRNYLDDLLNGKKGSVRQEFLPKIAEALDLAPEELSARLLGDMLAPLRPAIDTILATQDGAKTGRVYTPPPSFFDNRDTIPVFAAAEGGNGHSIISHDEIERVARPHTLEGIPEGYAILITGESMVPAYRPGDKAWVHPRMPPMRGQDVILYNQNSLGEANASIKHLVTWTDKQWTVEQYNPPKKFKLERSEWPICHQVVGKFNRR